MSNNNSEREIHEATGKPIYKAYEAPGKGVWGCIGCDFTQEIVDDTEELIICPVCGIWDYIQLD